MALAVCPPAAAAVRPGSIDRGFAGDGSLGLGYGWASSVAVQPGGRIVSPIVGAWLSDGEFATRGSLVVQAFTPRGTLDRTFGNGGRAHLGRPARFGSARPDIAVLPDGKMIIAALERAGLYVARLHRDGTLDASFGDSGAVVLPDAGMSRVAVERTGRITLLYSGGKRVIRLLPSGRPDPDFGQNGRASIPGLPVGGFSRLVVQVGGAVVLAGAEAQIGEQTLTHLIRLRADGTRDTAFGEGGTAELVGPGGVRSVTLSDMAALPDGRLRVAVRMPPVGPMNGSRYRVAGLTANGTLDARFGTRGWSPHTEVSGVQAPLALDSRGSAVLPVGVSRDDGWTAEIGLTRVTGQGRADRSFGVAAGLPRRSIDSTIGDVVIDSAGGILVMQMGNYSSQKANTWIDLPSIHRYHGGYDRAKPSIRVGGVPRRCVSGTFRARVRISDLSRLVAVGVRVDGRRRVSKPTRRARLRIRGQRLRPGRHSIRVVARDAAGNRAVKVRRFTRCG